jgi:hypothetical protein
MKGSTMNAALRLFGVILFAVIGGFLVYTAAEVADGFLHPECNLCRLAGLSLFATLLLFLGGLALVWPNAGQNDPALWR